MAIPKRTVGQELGEVFRNTYISLVPGDRLSRHTPWSELRAEKRERYNATARAILAAATDEEIRAARGVPEPCERCELYRDGFGYQGMLPPHTCELAKGVPEPCERYDSLGYAKE